MELRRTSGLSASSLAHVEASGQEMGPRSVVQTKRRHKIISGYALRSQHGPSRMCLTREDVTSIAERNFLAELPGARMRYNGGPVLMKVFVEKDGLPSLL